MGLYEEIVSRRAKISLIGLGYVGLPVAVAFAKKVDVIGFDVNAAKIELYKAGIDPTNEVGHEGIRTTTVDFTSDELKLRDARFHIVAVPTPVKADNTPDLAHIRAASSTLGRNLTRGSIVVYESTVYPGVTEDICVPILEKESGLRIGLDFSVGYSPERINPGDKLHRLETIVKVVSAMDADTLDTVAKIYELVVEVGIYKAESIKVAEASKVIENSQRDINIAFMNELSIIFNRMGIDTKAVLAAAETKWNFLRFQPGLVGGHCIGVDPYYLTYRAKEMGYHSQVILAGRKINDDMARYVAENTIKKMIQAHSRINGAKVAVFGITFKENCPDVRNSKVVDLIRELEGYGVEVIVVDPVAEPNDLWHEYGIKLASEGDVSNIDAAIFAVPHNEFRTMTLFHIQSMFGVGGRQAEAAVTSGPNLQPGRTARVLIDVKGIFDRHQADSCGFVYWRL